MGKRAKNFDQDEIDILLKLVEQHAHTIECKKTHPKANKKKEAVWFLIETDYNKVAERYRTAEELKIKYGNLKKDMRRRQAKGLQIVDEHIDNTIRTILKNIKEECTDGDHALEDPISQTVLTPNKEYFNEVIESWQKEDLTPPASSRSPKVYTPPKKQIIKNKYTRLTENHHKWKINKMRRELAIMNTEHRMKVQFMQEEHELKLEKLRLELEILKNKI